VLELYRLAVRRIGGRLRASAVPPVCDEPCQFRFLDAQPLAVGARGDAVEQSGFPQGVDVRKGAVQSFRDFAELQHAFLFSMEQIKRKFCGVKRELTSAPWDQSTTQSSKSASSDS